VKFYASKYYGGMKFFLLLLIGLSSLAFSQDDLDVRFLGTQRTSGSPFAIPVSVDGQGKISLFGGNGTQSLSFNPNMQLGYNRANIEYSQPVVLNRFNFYPVQKEIWTGVNLNYKIRICSWSNSLQGVDADNCSS
jgi:hypothetical protein